MISLFVVPDYIATGNATSATTTIFTEVGDWSIGLFAELAPIYWIVIGLIIGGLFVRYLIYNGLIKSVRKLIK